MTTYEPVYLAGFKRWLDTNQGRVAANTRTLFTGYGLDQATAYQKARLEQAYKAGFASAHHHFRSRKKP